MGKPPISLKYNAYRCMGDSSCASDDSGPVAERWFQVEVTRFPLGFYLVKEIY
jgi:hypothetical protein